MLESIIFMLLIKYWYIVIPITILIVDIAGQPKRQEMNEKINRALHKPY